MVKSFAYDAFGNQLGEEETSSTPFRYNGEYYDEEIDLIYLRNRYYSPPVGQFITEDPVKDGTNWYVYACDIIGIKTFFEVFAFILARFINRKMLCIQ